MIMKNEIMIEHAVNTGKVIAGGCTLGGGIYAFISSLDITQATAWASFIAASSTAIYFIISSLYAMWKWYKEARGKK